MFLEFYLSLERMRLFYIKGSSDDDGTVVEMLLPSKTLRGSDKMTVLVG